jgi:hypothetical protein
MPGEADLLLVLLGLQTNSVGKEQVVECVGIWAQDRARSLADILEEKGYLRKDVRAALEALAADRVERAGGASRDSRWTRACGSPSCCSPWTRPRGAPCSN